MKFRYIGSNENMTAFGYDFRDGNEPEVTDDNAIKRLSGNRYFEAVASEVEQDKAPSPSVVDAIAEASKNSHPFSNLATIVWDGVTFSEAPASAKKRPGSKPKAAQEP
jgi:hypothetical protein